MFDAVVWGGYKLGDAHLEQSIKAEGTVGYFGHRMIALIEYFPLLGTLVAKIDEWFCVVFYSIQAEKSGLAKKELASFSKAISSLEELEKLGNNWKGAFGHLQRFEQLDAQLLQQKRLEGGDTFFDIIRTNFTTLTSLGLTAQSLGTKIDAIMDDLMDGKSFEGSIVVAGQTYYYHSKKAVLRKSSELSFEGTKDNDIGITTSIISGMHYAQGSYVLKSDKFSVDLDSVEHEEFKYCGFMDPDKVLQILLVLTGLDEEALQAVIAER